MKGDLFRAWKRLKKRNGWDDPERTSVDLRAIMIRLSPVPDGMAGEIAEFFLPDPIDVDAVDKSEEILELLNGTLVSENSVLEPDEWTFLEEQVNAWAMEMDMNVVTHVMKAVLNQGDFWRDNENTG